MDLYIQGHPGLYGEFQDSQHYVERPRLKELKIDNYKNVSVSYFVTHLSSSLQFTEKVAELGKGSFASAYFRRKYPQTEQGGRSE